MDIDLEKETKMSSTKILIITLLISLLAFSCSQESDDLANVYDVLYISNDGAEIPSHIYGNAASKTFVIMLHGGPGGTGLDYRVGPYSRVLEQRYAMVYFDQRAQGMAQGNISKSDITVEAMVDDIVLLANVLKQKYGEDISLFVMGHSWGGTLGTALMSDTDRQALFSGWMEVSGAHDFQLMFKAVEGMIDTVSAEQIAAGNNVDFWRQAQSDIADMNFDNLTDANIQALNTLGFQAEQKLQEDGVVAMTEVGDDSAGVLLDALFTKNNNIHTSTTGGITNQKLFDDGLWRRDYSSGIRQIEIPTLLIWGQYDFVVPPALAQQAFDLLATEDKEMHIFTRSGHSPMQTEADQFVSVVTSFIDKYK